MEIQYEYGDITKTSCKYICHGVNAQGKMGSGVAKALKEAFPKSYRVYKDTFQKNGLKLGQVFGAACGTHTILHLVSQKYYGRDGARYVDYLAIRKGIRTINNNIKEPVAFPLIGCGLAGGDWKIVSSIIEEESTNFQPIVYIIDNDEVPF